MGHLGLRRAWIAGRIGPTECQRARNAFVTLIGFFVSD
jgi:hypothetical protein